MDLAFIQTDVGAGCDFEMTMLAAELPKRGIAVTRFLKCDLVEGRTALPNDCLVAGEVDAVAAAMRRMGIAVPTPNDYPASIRDLLRRRLWTDSLKDLRRRFEVDWPEPVFAKPATDRKLFRGRVFHSSFDFESLKDLPGETPVVCSEVVPIISEFRFFVIDSRIVARENYDGDPRDEVDIQIVESAIRRLDEAGESLAAYAIDFGLHRDGTTMLIEMNDGFSIGTYGDIDPGVYADFTMCRWQQLLETRQ